MVLRRYTIANRHDDDRLSGAYGTSLTLLLSPLGVGYLGPRKAMMLCILIWTIALILAGRYIIRSIIICRILLNRRDFIIHCKAYSVKRWFPKQERGRANAAWIVGQSVAPAIAMPFFHTVDRHPRLALNFFYAPLSGLILFGCFGDMLLINQNNIKSISR